MINAQSTQLANGKKIPSLGLGTWKIPNALTSSIIEDAISVGYRHFDCACDYGNEPQVGRGLEKAISGNLCTREDLWVTSKLWNTYHEPKHVRAACERSLKDLQLDELDLYLVHFPISLAFVPFDQRYPPGWFFEPESDKPEMNSINVSYTETWSAMEDLQRAGLVKQIGVCNLTVSLLREVLNHAEIRPAVHQVELHPYLSQEKLLRYCSAEGIAIEAFSPLGAESYLSLDMAKERDRVMGDRLVTSIASTRLQTPAQIILRWAIQRGTIPIPKTQSTEHLRENFAIFDFELSDEEMQKIDSLNRNQRFNDPGDFGEKAFNTFYPIFD